MLFKILKILLFTIFLVGCFEEPKKTTSTLVIKSNIITAQLTGGVMIWGVGPNNIFMGLSLLDETQKKEVELAVGPWHLFAVGWMGGNKLTGAQKCGAANITLIEGVPATVSFNMTTANCGGSDFSPGGHLSSNQFLPLKFITCNDLTAKTAGSNCDGAAKGGAKSYKLFFSEFNSSIIGSAPLPGLFTPCVNDPGSTNSITPTTSPAFPIPVGKTGLWPMHTVLEVYDAAGCTGMKKNFIFMDGLKNPVTDTLVFANGGYTEVFVKTLSLAPNISYSSTATIQNTVSMTSMSPTNSGGSVASWTISGQPSGITINSSTGVISGTASDTPGTFNATVTATNGALNDTFVITFTLQVAPPVITTYSTNSATYIVGQTGIVNTPTYTGTSVTFSISPSLPTGLTINSSTGVISGSTSTQTASANYTVTATDVNSNIDTHIVTIEVVQPASLTISDGPSNYDFGIKANGSSTDKTFTINNVGGYVATSMTGSGLASPFSFKGGSYPGTGGSCTAGLAAGSSCTVVVTYSPTFSSSFSDTMDISFNNGLSGLIASRGLDAVGAPPATLTISDGPTYDYGMKILTQAGYKQFTITNTGGVEATEIVDVGMASPFGFNGGVHPGTNGDCGSTLAAGNFCTIEIKYYPIGPGNHNDTIDLSYNDGAGYQNAQRAIQGFAVNAAQVTLSSATLNFHVAFDYPATPNYLGTYDASSNTPSLTPTSSGNYRIVNTAGNTGGYGQLEINDWIIYDGANWIKAPPKKILTLTLSNGAGRADATISGISGMTAPFNFLDGTFPGTGGTCTSTLVSGGTCTIKFEFVPVASVAKYTQNISINYNNGLVGTNVGLTLEGKAGEIVQVAGTGTSTCALFNNGSVKCWGLNSNGQLAIGNTTNIGDGAGEMGSNLAFASLGTGFKIKKLAAGAEHFCLLTTAGQVKCWGRNNYGQLGYENTTTIGTSGGQLGNSLAFVNLGSGVTAKDISAGGYGTCVITNSDLVKCWGLNINGQLGHSNTMTIGDGSVEMGNSLPTVDLGTGRTALQISVGYDHVCAVLDNATIKCWGNGANGKRGTESTTSTTMTSTTMGDNLPTVNLGSGYTGYKVVASTDSTCAILLNSSVKYIKCWGNNTSGTLGRENTTPAGGSGSTMGSFLNPIAYTIGGEKIIDVQMETNSVMILKDDNEINTWGYGFYGLLGTGSTSNIGTTPGDMGGNTPLVDLGTGILASKLITGGGRCVIVDNGELKCWGSNSSGQLGLGDASNRGDAVNEMGDFLPYVELH